MDISMLLNILQVVSIIWVLAFGSKSVYDLVQSRQQGKPFKVNPWFIVSIVLAIGILVLSVILFPILVPPYPPIGWKQVLNDPLKTNSFGWQVETGPRGSCRFTNDVYQVTSSSQNNIHYCLNASTDFTNFTFEAQMTIVNGDAGGIRFRHDGNTGSAYNLTIYRSGAYRLALFQNHKFSKTIGGNITPAIHSGLNQLNLIAITVQGDRFNLFVNKQLISTMTDEKYSLGHGNIGFLASDINTPTEVIYSNAEIWVPSSS